MSYSKLLTFTTGGQTRYGAIDEAGGIADLSGQFGARWPTLREAVAANGLAELLAAARGRPA